MSRDNPTYDMLLKLVKTRMSVRKFRPDQAPNGYFTFGYNDGASVLRDFVQRLVRAGLPFDDAMQYGLLGAMEGWYGINEEGQEHDDRAHRVALAGLLAGRHHLREQ